MKRITVSLVLALAAAACSEGVVPRSEPSSTAPAPSPSPTPTEKTQVTIYYLIAFDDRIHLAPERHQVTKSQAIARAALEELVHGKAQDPDHTTPYPPASTINSLTVTDRIATVDWSADVLTATVGSDEERLGIQSVVYTLTEFPTIKQVRFTVEGKDRGAASNGRTIEDWWSHIGLAGQPWDRDPAIDALEPIALFSPLDGASSSGTLRISGEASTFEANVVIVLRDAAGRRVLRTFTNATAGAPGRGAFSKTITFTPPAAAQTWTLQVFEESAEDGSVQFMEDRKIKVG